jgi:hypothetical protein
VINPDIQETEEFIGNARAKRPREEALGNLQWKRVEDSQCPSKIHFSDISSPIKASKAIPVTGHAGP